MRFLAEDVSYCSLSRTRLKFSLLILHRKVLRSHATYRYSYYKVLYLIAAQGIFLAASQRKIRCFFGSGAYSCRCANGVRVTPDDKRYCAAPPGSTAARRHLYGTKMSEHAAPYGGKSSATANTPPHRAIENGDTPHTAINGTPYIRLYSGKIYVPCRPRRGTRRAVPCIDIWRRNVSLDYEVIHVWRYLWAANGVRSRGA